MREIAKCGYEKIQYPYTLLLAKLRRVSEYLILEDRYTLPVYEYYIYALQSHKYINIRSTVRISSTKELNEKCEHDLPYWDDDTAVMGSADNYHKWIREKLGAPTPTITSPGITFP